MALIIPGAWLRLEVVLGLSYSSFWELATYGTTMTSALLSREGCITPRLVVFYFTVVKSDPTVLRMLGCFPYSTSCVWITGRLWQENPVSNDKLRHRALYADNRPLIGLIALHLPDGLDTICVCVRPSFTLSCFFTIWSYEKASANFGFGWCLPGWGLRDGDSFRAETLRGATQKRI